MDTKQTFQAVRQAQAVLGMELADISSTLLNQISLANATCELLEQIHEHVQKTAEFPRKVDFGTSTEQEHDAMLTAHVIKKQITDLSQRVWVHRKELRPLALAYGYYIVKHDKVVGIGSLQPSDWAWGQSNED